MDWRSMLNSFAGIVSFRAGLVDPHGTFLKKNIKIDTERGGEGMGEVTIKMLGTFKQI